LYDLRRAAAFALSSVGHSYIMNDSRFRSVASNI
jgi:hypothetical protein